MVDITWSNPLCLDHEKCTCEMVLTGIDERTRGYQFRSRNPDRAKMWREACAHFAANFTIVADTLITSYGDVDEHYFKQQLNERLNVRLIPAPIIQRPFNPESITRNDPPIEVKRILKEIDKEELTSMFSLPSTAIDWEELFTPGQTGVVPSLKTLILSKFSAYNMAFETPNGRPTVVSAQCDLYPFKLADSILGYNRPVHEMAERAKPVIRFLPDALNIFYNRLGINDFGKYTSELNFSHLRSTYMGSSGGIHPVKVPKDGKINLDGVSHKVTDGVKMKIGGSGKKAEFFDTDLEDIMNFLVNDIEFETFFSITAKNEYRFDRTKCLSLAEFWAWSRKNRVFIIPTSTFVMAERLVSNTRMLIERGFFIRIGQKWTWGGSEALAKQLGVKDCNEWLKVFVEGDCKNFDQGVKQMWIKFYMSIMLIHENKESPDYRFKEKLVKYLAERMASRITRIFAELWAIFSGSVPSGCFNTSHLDSFTMSMYIFLFALWQLHNCLPEHKKELELFITNLMLVIYGDDHVYNKGTGITAAYLDGVLFADFMKQFFDVEVRDMYNGVPYVSIVDKGFLVKRGVCFLKHYHIKNPHIDFNEGQAKYLPFRETWDYIIRAVWGREVKSRDLLDVLFSVLGHAYGTYASNYHAYCILKKMYWKIIHCLGMNTGTAMNTIIDRLGPADLRRIRQMSITTDEIRRGFPTWEDLIIRNTYKPEYHDFTVRNFDHDFSYLTSNDWDRGSFYC